MNSGAQPAEVKLRKSSLFYVRSRPRLFLHPGVDLQPPSASLQPQKYPGVELWGGGNHGAPGDSTAAAAGVHQLLHNRSILLSNLSVKVYLKECRGERAPLNRAITEVLTTDKSVNRKSLMCTWVHAFDSVPALEFTQTGAFCLFFFFFFPGLQKPK